jgi:hypothetical protein
MRDQPTAGNQESEPYYGFPSSQKRTTPLRHGLRREIARNDDPHIFLAKNPINLPVY